MPKKKIPWIEITAVCTLLLLIMTIIALHDKLSIFFRSIVKIFIKIFDILSSTLLFKVPIYFLLLLIILFFLVRIIIKKIKRRDFMYIRGCVLFQIFQLEEIGEESLISEYIEILHSGFGNEINNEILPKEKELEFRNIITDLLNNKLIIAEADTRDEGKLYKLTDKGRRYAKRKGWNVL